MSIPQYRERDIQILTIQPDERFDIELSENFRTIVKEGLDTSEERRQCFPRPLYGLVFTATTQDPVETAFIRKQIELAEADPFGVPFWPHKTMLTVAAPIGTSTLTVDSTVGLLFPTFDYVLIWSSYDRWEVLLVSSALVSGTIDLAEVTTLDWDTGTEAAPVFVMPLTVGELKRPPADSLTDDHAQIKFEFLEVFNLHVNNTSEGDAPIPPIVPQIEYNGCKDEITVSWTGLALHEGPITDPGPGVRNVEILHSDSPDGPWLFWGETRVPASQVVLSNYFKTRWLLIHAQSFAGNITVAKFKAEAPNVDPPQVELKQWRLVFDPDLGHDVLGPLDPVGIGNMPALYAGPRVAAPYRQFDMPYSSAYTGLDSGFPPKSPGGSVTDPAQWPIGYGGTKSTPNSGADLPKAARDVISAIFPGNLSDVWRVNLFSDAFVEVGWRYAPLLYDGFNSPTGRRLRVTLSTAQAGATCKFTFDGTDPSLSNGHTSGADIDPAQIGAATPFVPYIIARAFKDGCKSAPVYIPVDLVLPQLSGINAWGLYGTGHAGHQCGVFYYDSDGALQTFFGSGDGTNWPCLDVDLGSLRIAAIGNACGGLAPLETGQDLRQRTGTGVPVFMTRPEIDNPKGPYLGGIPSDIFGGGAWSADCSMTRLHHFVITHDPNFTHKPSDAFYLVNGVVTLSGVPTAFPTGPRGRSCENMTGSGTTNNFADVMHDSVPGEVFDCPSDGQHDVLTGANVTITCARA